MRLRANVFVKLALGVFLIFAFVTILNLSMQVNTLKEKQYDLAQQVADKQIQVEKLRDEYASEIDDEYIKRVAKEELGYHDPGEIIYYNDLTK
ncbi:MAG: septum formation initiator family protein [Clostridia bacterium]|nr:septum formation initiator family protein [Clostridia bacterium]